MTESRPMRTKTPYRPWTRYRATVSRRGQITIPAALRRHHGWQPGRTRLLIATRGDRFEVRRVGSLAAETAGSPARVASRRGPRKEDVSR